MTTDTRPRPSVCADTRADASRRTCGARDEWLTFEPMGRSLGLSTRLGISHGVLVALLFLLLVVTLQGVVRMLGVIVELRDQRLSSVDSEEEVHRAAWDVEVAMRRGRATCTPHGEDPNLTASIESAIANLEQVLGRNRQTTPRLRHGAERYVSLASGALDGNTCDFLLLASTDQRRTLLDEEMTDAWIARLQELHADMEAKEERARRIGTSTTAAGVVLAVVAAIAAVAVVRSTGRSVAEPIRKLAASATRLGEGDFAPIDQIKGPREVEELWADLERARGKLAEVERLKQGFLASVSHEMRSPLASVREGLSLLADGSAGPLSERQSRIVSLAVRACEREVRIVEALLDLSRLRSGKPLKLEAACDIDKVIEAAVEDERADAVRRGVEVGIDRSGGAPLVQIDSALVERAVANLVRNAVSVSKPGQQVRVARAMEEAGGARVLTVRVRDEGPGLAEGLEGTLFRPFGAAPVPLASRPAGIGLGLSFAREVARAHGGDVSIERTSHEGTTFRLDLPAASTHARSA